MSEDLRQEIDHREDVGLEDAFKAGVGIGLRDVEGPEVGAQPECTGPDVIEVRPSVSPGSCRIQNKELDVGAAPALKKEFKEAEHIAAGAAPDAGDRHLVAAQNPLDSR